jgi:hypothetical protein
MIFISPLPTSNYSNGAQCYWRSLFVSMGENFMGYPRGEKIIDQNKTYNYPDHNYINNSRLNSISFGSNSNYEGNPSLIIGSNSHLTFNQKLNISKLNFSRGRYRFLSNLSKLKLKFET